MSEKAWSSSAGAKPFRLPGSVPVARSASVVPDGAAISPGSLLGGFCPVVIRSLKEVDDFEVTRCVW